MITRNSATKEWLDTVMKSYKKNDPGIVEKTIMALTLLEQLSVEGLDFIFKGRTSLMLLLDSYNRLSLDIDILLPVNPRTLKIYSTGSAKKEYLKAGLRTNARLLRMFPKLTMDS